MSAVIIEGAQSTGRKLPFKVASPDLNNRRLNLIPQPGVQGDGQDTQLISVWRTKYEFLSTVNIESSVGTHHSKAIRWYLCSSKKTTK